MTFARSRSRTQLSKNLTENSFMVAMGYTIYREETDYEYCDGQ